MEGKRRSGRPTTAPRAGEKATLGIRASAELKGRLLEVAAVNDRSLSAEAEIRLEQSFRAYDVMAAAFGGREGLSFALNLFAPFRFSGERRAAELGIEGHWMQHEECYFAALYGMLRGLYEATPGPWDGQRLKLISDNALVGAQIRRVPPAAPAWRTGFIDPDT
jgi:hypothetical protein